MGVTVRSTGRTAVRASGALALATLLLLGGSAGAATTILPVGDVVERDGITRTVIGATQPANAPGELLYLTRVRIAPRTPLPEHFHAGTQIARVERGVLTYEIVQGSAVVNRADGAVEPYTAPVTLKLRAGDVVNEAPDMVHRGRNATTRPVVTVTAALISSTAGLSTAVGPAVPGTPIATPDFELAVTGRDTTTLGIGGTRQYGTVVERATTTVGGEAVGVDITVQVDYTSGSGPYTGLLTLTWPDGSKLGASMAGSTLATADGGARFGATLAVIGGSGRFAGATGGSGLYTGSRAAAIGSPLMVRIDLRVTGL